MTITALKEVPQDRKTIDVERIRATVSPWQSNNAAGLGWNVELVRSALLQHTSGKFNLSSRLYDKLGEDDDIPSSLEKRVNAMLKSTFSIKTEDEAMRNILTENWLSMVPSGTSFESVRQHTMLGFSVGTIDWDTSGNLWIPTLRILPPEFLRYDISRQSYYYNCQQGDLPVVPGDGKWFMMTRTEKGYMYGAIRSLALLWLAKQFNNRDWARYNEKHGNPILKTDIPIGTSDPEKNAFISAVRQLGAEGIIACPVGLGDDNSIAYDVTLLEPTAQSYDSFRLMNERIDRKIQVNLLGNNIGTEVASTGSNRAAAETAQAGLDSLKASVDADIYGEALKNQLIRPFVQLNFGDKPIPYPFWDPSPKKDLIIRATALKTLGDALLSLETNGRKVSQDSLDRISSEFDISFDRS